MKKVFSLEVAGRTLSVEVGQFAQLANGAAMVRYGDTAILSTATMSKQPREGIDFFPLSVDYEERLYSVGKIPGGFIRREGKPTEKAVLTARVIDRQMRPRFPKDLRNDVSIVNTVLSVDQDNSPEFASIIGTAVALCISDIPFNGPIAGVILGLVDGEVVINPNTEQRLKSEMYVTLSADMEKIIMIEAGANQVTEEVMLDAIKKGHDEIKRIISFIDDIVKEVGKPKAEYERCVVPDEIWNKVYEIAWEDMKAAMMSDDKTIRDLNVDTVCNAVQEKLAETFPEQKQEIADALYKLQKKVVRTLILDEGKRIDGRGMMKSARCIPTWLSFQEPMVRDCSNAGRPRCSPMLPWARWGMSRLLMELILRKQNDICTTTISRPIVWEKQDLPEAPAGVRSGMELWQSGHLNPSSPANRNSHMPSALFPRS